jgi:hypothetical protein
MKTYFIYASCWIGMVVIAILNGAIREKVYGKFISELAAHQLSTIVGLVLFGIYIWIITGIFPIESAKTSTVHRWHLANNDNYLRIRIWPLGYEASLEPVISRLQHHQRPYMDVDSDLDDNRTLLVLFDSVLNMIGGITFMS